MERKTQHQELRIFTTILKSTSLLSLLILWSFTSYTQVLEASAKVSQGFVQLNDKPTSQPFLDEKGLDFYTEEVTSNSLPAFEFYGGMRMRDFPLIFGMSFTLNRFETTYKGYTQRHSDNTLGQFAIQKSGLLFSYAYRIGYRHNAFKTFRPFVFVDLGLMANYSDKILSTQLIHEGFTETPDLSLYSSIDIKRRFGLSLGFEWRDLVFSFDIHRMREELVYDGEGKDIPYNKRRLYSFGITYFFIREKFYKSAGRTVSSPKEGYTHQLNYVKRSPKYFSIIGGVGAHIYVGGAGMAKDVTDDVTFLNLKTTTTQISSATDREDTEITMMKFGYYSSENTGIPRYNLGLALHKGNVEVEIMGHYYQFINRHEYEFTYDKISRYITNGNAYDYFREGDFNYNSLDFSLINTIQSSGVTVAMKYKFKPSDSNGFPIYLGAGWNQNYYAIKSSNLESVNSQGLELATDMVRSFNGESGVGSGENYYSTEDENYYLSDEAFAYLVETKDGYEPLDDYASSRSSIWQKMNGLTLYAGLHYARFDVRFGFEWSWTDDFYLIRKVNTGFISATYHLWGK
ncbi:hypothetical protein [Parvicella tangerina]|uniref:Uncharacterized protein n=1 Tax=Parvicella tangerina TaxID=2829795 RepID=A0A916JMQ6_9FLAO|nr:hypothetical protein [Parvicella tangerina]CAG5082464.1 hypothetical protein CRYO30217_01925 [Parvicella tangerina]